MAFELKKTQLSYKEHREFKYSIQSSKLSFGSSARNHAILSGKLPVLEKYNPNSRSTEEINREYRVAVTLSEITLAKAKALWETLAKERKDEKKARMAAEDDWKSGKSRNTKKHIERAPDKVSPTKKEIMGNPEKFVQTGEKRNIFEIMMANSAKRSKNAF